MRRESLSLANVAVILALAGNAACTRFVKSSGEINAATPQRTAIPTEPIQNPYIRLSSPTVEATASPKATETLVSDWQKPLDQRFSLGSFDPSKTGYILELPQETLNTMLFTDTVKDFEANPALRIVTPFLPTDVMDAFVESGEKDGGKTPIAFLTDTNMLLLYAHSESWKAPGEAARIIASFVLKNPDKASEIIGKKVIFKTNDGKEIQSSIAFVKSFTAPQFDDNSSPNRLWGVYPEKDNIIFFLTDAAGIPESIRNDKTHSYIGFASCLPQNGDSINVNPFDPNRVSFNTAERALVVLRLENP